MDKELISAYEFAKRKGVSPTIIYRHIKEHKTIDTQLIGKAHYIDWNKYSHVTFNSPLAGKPRATREY